MASVKGKGFYTGKEEPIEGFTIRCDKCGNEDVKIEDTTGCGSEWTGMYGDVSIHCPNCGNDFTILDF